MILGLAVAVAGAALLAAVVLRIRLAGALAASEEAQSREAAALRESVDARRAAAASTADQQFLSRVVRALPYFIHELHGGVGRRDVPQLLLDAVVRLLEPTRGLVAVARRPVVDGDPPVLAVAAVWPPEEQPQLGKSLAVGEGEIGFALEVRRVLDRHDFDNQPAPLRARLARDTPPEWRPDLVAPLFFREDLAGVIALQAPSRNPAELKDVLRLLAHLGAVALYTNARYDEMKASADTDGLTGLLNKRTIGARLADEVRMFLAHGQNVSVFMFDIDHFKHYNDRNGHLAGDRLLQSLTRVARQHTRPEHHLRPLRRRGVPDGVPQHQPPAGAGRGRERAPGHRSPRFPPRLGPAARLPERERRRRRVPARRHGPDRPGARRGPGALRGQARRPQPRPHLRAATPRARAAARAGREWRARSVVPLLGGCREQANTAPPPSRSRRGSGTGRRTSPCRSTVADPAAEADAARRRRAGRPRSAAARGRRRVAHPPRGCTPRATVRQSFAHTLPPEWRNWQTRGTQNPEGPSPVWVQFPPPAPIPAATYGRISRRNSALRRISPSCARSTRSS